MDKTSTPYQCHVFVCTNDRKGERKSCADGGSPDVKAQIKREVELRGWKPQVRVSQSGCLGPCESGSNIMIYPQGIWLKGVTSADVGAVITCIGELIGSSSS